jgi:hypothetical protein
LKTQKISSASSDGATWHHRAYPDIQFPDKSGDRLLEIRTGRGRILIQVRPDRFQAHAVDHRRMGGGFSDLGLQENAVGRMNHA